MKKWRCKFTHSPARSGWVDSITPRDTASGIWCIRGWVSARASLDVAQSLLLYNSLTETSAFKVFHLAIMSVTKALQHEWYIDGYEYGALVQQYWQEKTEALGQSVPLYPPQIPHGLTWDRTRASVMWGHWVTTVGYWFFAGTNVLHLFHGVHT
jgi:hypothetical protein